MGNRNPQPPNFADWTDIEITNLIGIDDQGNLNPAYEGAAMADCFRYYPRLFQILTRGAMVSQKELTEIIEHRISDSQFKIERLSAAALDPHTPHNVADLQRAMVTELRNMHIQVYLAGLRVSPAS